MSAPSSSSQPAVGFQFYTEPVGELSSPSQPGILKAVIPPGINGKSRLLQVLHKQLKLPDYFGANWDALDECLRDWSWLEGLQGVRIIHSDLPFQPGRRSRRIYLQILHDALQTQPADFPFEVLFPAHARAGVQSALQAKGERPA